jgi:hypothetical protein
MVEVKMGERHGNHVARIYVARSQRVGEPDLSVAVELVEPVVSKPDARVDQDRPVGVPDQPPENRKGLKRGVLRMTGRNASNRGEVEPLDLGGR